MRVFEVIGELVELNSLIEVGLEAIDPETGEFIDNGEAIDDLIKSLTTKKGDLLDYLVDKRNEVRGAADILQAKIELLQARKKSVQLGEERIMQTIESVLEGEKFKSDEHTFFYQKTISLEILDKFIIPAEFISFEPKIDKAELKKYMTLVGEDVAGATLVEKIGLRIR